MLRIATIKTRAHDSRNMTLATCMSMRMDHTHIHRMFSHEHTYAPRPCNKTALHCCPTDLGSSLAGTRLQVPSTPRQKTCRTFAVRTQASQDVKKVVLAYSGGLDTSIILKWLQDTYNCEVVTFTADLGQVWWWYVGVCMDLLCGVVIGLKTQHLHGGCWVVVVGCSADECSAHAYIVQHMHMSSTYQAHAPHPSYPTPSYPTPSYPTPSHQG